MKKEWIFILIGFMIFTSSAMSQKTTQEKVVRFVIHTDYGNMQGYLYNETPRHRDNFAKLVKDGYFNDLLFHRVIPGFMIQGGDPNSRNAKPGVALGSGGPGYKVAAEFNKNLIHKKGALSAARQGDEINPEKASSGSQFYIVEGRPLSAAYIEDASRKNGIQYSPEQKAIYESVGGYQWLDGAYTVFGEITEGLDVITKIASVQKDARDRPVQDIKMTIKLID
ncbi:MAG: peptidylprolyl isomerase [Bacteroidales bacterium]|nr:peptidylprolyl isomerase [Deltaproteobacteria bacterium]MBL7138511.1 peptidylprolyl isomerase [Bacteroidales bacterium]